MIRRYQFPYYNKTYRVHLAKMLRSTTDTSLAYSTHPDHSSLSVHSGLKVREVFSSDSVRVPLNCFTLHALIALRSVVGKPLGKKLMLVVYQLPFCFPWVNGSSGVNLWGIRIPLDRAEFKEILLWKSQNPPKGLHPQMCLMLHPCLKATEVKDIIIPLLPRITYCVNNSSFVNSDSC